MRRMLFATRLALRAPAALIAPAPAFAAGIAIAMDAVHTVTFDTPVATVYVGNPSIADVNMIDSRHAFIIGKGFGSTNIVALDGDGKQVFDSPVSVLSSSGNDSTLVLNRGTQRVTYSCTSSHCEAAAVPGDSKDVFDQINGELSAHSDSAHKAAQGQ
jgi:Flp pilus assembly secretin CpaC